MTQDFTPEEKDFLRRDAFIAAVVKQRSSGQQETWWRFVLTSPVGTACITVVLSGVAAALITGSYQERQKDRDVQLAINQLRTTLVDEVLTMAGKVQGNAESRIEIDGPMYARRLDVEAERINAEQKLNVRHAFNQTWAEWDTKKQSMLARIKLNLGIQPASTWSDLIVAMDHLLNCASGHIPNPSGANLCETDSKDTSSKAELFLSALEKVQHLR